MSNPLDTCPTCKGLGDIRVGRSSNSIKVESCPTCHGSGHAKITQRPTGGLVEKVCERCNGTGQVPEGGKIPTTAEMMQAAEESGKVQQAVIDEYEGGKPDYALYICRGTHCKCLRGRDDGCMNYHNGDHACPSSTSAPVQAKPETIKLADLIRRVEALENHYHPLEGQIAFSDGKPLGKKDE